MTKELWETLDSIDGTTVIEGSELENWRLGCAYQAENHPDGEVRAMFQRATTMNNLTRKDCRALASLGVYPQSCDDCNDL